MYVHQVKGHVKYTCKHSFLYVNRVDLNCSSTDNVFETVCWNPEQHLAIALSRL